MLFIRQLTFLLRYLQDLIMWVKSKDSQDGFFFETKFEDSLEENPMFIPFWQKSLYYRERVLT